MKETFDILASYIIISRGIHARSCGSPLIIFHMEQIKEQVGGGEFGYLVSSGSIGRGAERRNVSS